MRRTKETRTGDLNRLAKRYLGGHEVDQRAITADQTAGMPLALRTLVRELIDEYEDQESLAARCARDADKLECMLQGIEYRDQGHAAAQRWIDDSRVSIQTKTGQALADLLLSMKPIAWLNHVLGEPGPA